jgi:hypothetical protein
MRALSVVVACLLLTDAVAGAVHSCPRRLVERHLAALLDGLEVVAVELRLVQPGVAAALFCPSLLKLTTPSIFVADASGLTRQGLACGPNSTRTRRPSDRAPSRAFRAEAAFDRASVGQGTSHKGSPVDSIQNLRQA